MHLEHAQPYDAHSVAALRNQFRHCFFDHGPVDPIACAKWISARTQDDCMFTAKLLPPDNRLVGTIGWSTASNGKVIVGRIMLNPTTVRQIRRQWRHYDAANEMCVLLCQQLLQRGISRVYAETLVDNALVSHLLKRLSFHCITIRRDIRAGRIVDIQEWTRSIITDLA